MFSLCQASLGEKGYDLFERAQELGLKIASAFVIRAKLHGQCVPRYFDALAQKGESPTKPGVDIEREGERSDCRRARSERVQREKSELHAPVWGLIAWPTLPCRLADLASRRNDLSVYIVIHRPDGYHARPAGYVQISTALPRVSRELAVK